jgi:hypothetical protein
MTHRLLAIACSAILFSGIAGAQTQLLRGDIGDIRGTNRFLLDGTTIELVSSTVNLQVLHDQSRQQNIDYEMRVTLVSAPPVVLNVVSAVSIPEMMDMGNMRLGESSRWQVNGTPGSTAWVFIGATAFTAYTPVGPLGTFLLGGPVALLAQGTINGQGQFEFNFTTPNDPSFVGVEITSQAVVQLPAGNFLVTNPDSRVIES